MLVLQLKQVLMVRFLGRTPFMRERKSKGESQLTGRVKDWKTTASFTSSVVPQFTRTRQGAPLYLSPREKKKISDWFAKVRLVSDLLFVCC